MIPLLTRFHFIPITHILIACTAASIATTFALFANQAMIIVFMYAIAGIVSIIRKKYSYVAVGILCSLFSLQIYFKIDYSKKTSYSDQEFLQKPCIVQATILQKQTNLLEKDQATLILQTTKIYHEFSGSLLAPKKIMCTMPAKRAERLHEGQSITIFKAMLSQPTSDNEYQQYMLKEQIWATMFLQSQKVLITNKSSISWFAKCNAQLCNALQTTTQHLFNPLFLGKREKSFESIFIQHQSLYWGIAHHMARSGIHLITLFGLFMGFFHYARIKHFYRYIIGATLMFMYFEISIASISFLRALSMIMLQIISKMHNFQYSSIHALTLTTLFMVSFNPWYVLFLDFQLSFGITAVIIWLFHAKWSKTVAFQSQTLIPS